MIDRRELMIALGATGLVAACQSGPPKPSVITVNVTGGAGMNPGPGGGDRPVTVLVMRLKSTGKFNSADYFALQGMPAAHSQEILSVPTRSPSGPENPHPRPSRSSRTRRLWASLH